MSGVCSMLTVYRRHLGLMSINHVQGSDCIGRRPEALCHFCSVDSRPLVNLFLNLSKSDHAIPFLNCETRRGMVLGLISIGKPAQS
jgi:hypothetical protein